jgi:hypothetical protein
MRIPFVMAAAATLIFAQGYTSPPAHTEVTINGKTISIKYHAPSVHGRKIFGPDGLIRQDSTYPVWRAGANEATALHTDADLNIGALAVPKGDYTLFILPEPGKWQLIVNKQTGQWGLEYHQNQDLGRVPMTTIKAPALVETFKMTLSSTGGNSGKLQAEWENVAASVPITVK